MDLASDGARDAPPGPSMAADSATPPSCGADQLRCLSSDNLCDRRSWDFENGAQDWDLAAYNARLSSTRARSGASSLAFEVFANAYSSTDYSFCKRRAGVDIRGMTLAAWVNLQVTSGKPAPTTCSVGGRGGGSFGPSDPVTLTPDRWTLLQVPIDPVDLNGGMEIGIIYVQCHYEQASPWTGLVYVDDVSLQ